MTHWVFDKVNKRFGDRPILRDVRVTLDAGDCQLLCGNNGAGKSTLLRILAGMERPNSAEIRHAEGGGSWRSLRRRLLRDFIYLHQQPYLFEGTVEYNLYYPLRGPRAERAEQVQEALQWSGLMDLAKQAVHKLSGGERQRVALARAWLRQPKVMLLDEPTSNMDVQCRARTIELLGALKREGVALLVATHDAQHFSGICDRVLRLEDGVLRDAFIGAPDFPAKVTPIDGFRASA